MKLLSKLERALTPYAVPNLTLGLIMAQVLVYVLAMSQPAIINQIILFPAAVLQGQLWRLVTFLAIPPTTNLLFAFFFWYLFFLMGTALEGYWGAFRYNVFLLIGYLATVGVAFMSPEMPCTNLYLQGSVFLAFATLYPEFVLYLFFVIPAKIKWLAALQVLTYIYQFATHGWSIRLIILASIANYLIFFWQDIVWRVRTGQRRMAAQVSRTTKTKQPFHRCTVCGITDLTNPEMDFRYCTQCDGSHGYCTEHVRNHVHIKKAAVPTTDAAPPPEAADRAADKR